MPTHHNVLLCPLPSNYHPAILTLLARNLWLAPTLPRAAAMLVPLVISPAADAALNAAVRGTAGLHLRFGLLLTVGLLAGALLDRWR